MAIQNDGRSREQQAMRNHGSLDSDIPFGMDPDYYLSNYAGKPPPAPVPATEAERETARNLPRGVAPAVVLTEAEAYAFAWARANLVGPRRRATRGGRWLSPKNWFCALAVAEFFLPAACAVAC